MKENAINFLVIEDNELDVEKISRGFRRLKIANKVTIAGDGYAALDMLRGNGIHEKLHGPLVVLLDLNMPRMNGFEFLEILRADDAIKHLPVFVLSTSDREKDIEEAYRLNVCGYIVKPIELEQLFEAIGTLGMYWQLMERPNA
ncbi:MAG: response regulator [Pseudomonadota bacterium]